VKAALVAFVLFLCAAVSGAEPRCGVDRWAKKTYSDVDAPRVNPAPIPTSISALSHYATHCKGLPTWADPDAELSVFEVVGRVVLVKLEDDSDYHVVLADPKTGDTMIVEIPDPRCVSSAQARKILGTVRSSFKAILKRGSVKGLLLRVTGIGFYDRSHGQKGMAPNCLELHPLLSVEVEK
jgi:hypothetical protein